MLFFSRPSKPPSEATPAENHLDLAFDIAVSLDRSVYDSLYLSVAATRKCRMVTADRKFYEAIKCSRLGDHVRWIEDGPGRPEPPK